MSKILGIIAEYNPFHNGHVYHIQNSKEQAGADYTVAVITGNFTQRGNAAIVNKWEKAKMAIKSGVDLVIELPTLYSISSAENFASGAIKILDELGIIDSLSFGIESNNISLLNNIANVLYEEPVQYVNYLKDELKQGKSFPKAREEAIIKYLKDPKYDNILNGSNNILAIEYLKALKKQKSKITPIGIRREKVYYNSKKIIDEYASATGIRYLMMRKQMEEVARVVPSSSFNILLENIKNGTYVLDLANYCDIIIYKLRSMTIKEIADLPEVSEGLENSIKQAVGKTNNIIELINMIKSKRYTQTRIQRIMLYALLNIKKADMEMSKAIKPYVRVLGFNENGRKLLSEIDPRVKVITSVSKFERENRNKKYSKMLEIDKYATDVYTIGYSEESKTGLDYTNGLIIM